VLIEESRYCQKCNRRVDNKGKCSGCDFSCSRCVCMPKNTSRINVKLPSRRPKRTSSLTGRTVRKYEWRATVKFKTKNGKDEPIVS
jgi:hypothetical protein